MSTPLRLHRLFLFGGHNAEELWPVINTAMFHWALIVFLPKWKHTAKLSLVIPMIFSLLYTLTTMSMAVFPEEGFEGNPDASFGSLQGIIALFDDPTALFAGWLHYIVFDALVGRWIVLDSTERGASNLFHAVGVVPCLIMTFVLGPMGFLVYTILIRTLLDAPEAEGEAVPRRGKKAKEN